MNPNHHMVAEITVASSLNKQVAVGGEMAAVCSLARGRSDQTCGPRSEMAHSEVLGSRLGEQNHV